MSLSLTARGKFLAALQKTWVAIYAERFPSSGFYLTGGPEKLFNESNDTSGQDFLVEIWIPVRENDCQRRKKVPHRYGTFHL